MHAHRIIRWENAQRYYLAWVQLDLFGNWLVCRRWGSLYNRMGNLRDDVVSSYEAGLFALEEIHKTRIKHHYWRAN
jgi:hypothetical protein